MSADLRFQVTLRHLAPDATKASYEFPESMLGELSPEQLRKLLVALASLAPNVEYPATPEVRIASPDGQYLVQVKDRHVRFSSWSTRAGNSDPSPEEIVAAITGTDVAAMQGVATAELVGALRCPRRGLAIGLLAAAILASNGITAWMLTRPPPDLLPEYRLLDADAANRLLSDTAGIYETGAAQGDRRLRLERDGRVRWEKLGDNRAIEEQTDLTAQAAQSAGHPALLTSARALIDIKDPSTLVYYGDTYRRAR